MRFAERKRWFAGIAALSVCLLLAGAAPRPAMAQDHDLVMFSLDANPKPLERGCTADLVASFLINGHQDDLLSPGDAEIRFYWADAANPIPTGPSGWSLIGSMSVTWAPSDGPFALGREWPTGFPSVAGSSLSWTVPESATSFHLKAEAQYTASGISDATPANNEMIAANVSSVEGTCPSTPHPCCVMTSVGLLCLVHCMDPGILVPFEKLRCLIVPELCEPWPPIPLCKLIDCNPCLLGLTCPPEPWDFLIRWPEEIMQVEVVSRGEVIAVSERLRRPIQRGDDVFYQVLRFTPRKDISYGIRTRPGGKAELGAAYPLQLEVQKAGKQPK